LVICGEDFRSSRKESLVYGMEFYEKNKMLGDEEEFAHYSVQSLA